MREEGQQEGRKEQGRVLAAKGDRVWYPAAAQARLDQATDVRAAEVISAMRLAAMKCD